MFEDLCLLFATQVLYFLQPYTSTSTKGKKEIGMVRELGFKSTTVPMWQLPKLKDRRKGDRPEVFWLLMK